jgi:hypothetical protein
MRIEGFFVVLGFCDERREEITFLLFFFYAPNMRVDELRQYSKEKVRGKKNENIMFS